MKLATGSVCFVAFASVLAAACSSDSDKPATDTTYTREQLLDPQTCGECHPKHYEEWSGSMHAYASEDPIFLAMNKRGQEETQGELGDFCIKCHSPMAVQEKATTDGLNMESVPKALQGVTCYFCHQVEDIAADHLSNNPLILGNDTTMRGGIKDPVKSAAHKSKYSPHLDGNELQDSSKMCGTCHDIQIEGHFSGSPNPVKLEQTYAEWQTTTFAQDGKSRQSCGDCHAGAADGGPQVVAEPKDSSVIMPVRERRHQHNFFAVDTALTDFPRIDEQAAFIQDGLDKALRAVFCMTKPGGDITVQLENLLGGHNFPSGASHDRRLWAEVHVYEKGVEKFSSGALPMQETVQGLLDQNGDDSVMTWWDKATKVDGSKAHMFWDVANIDRSVAKGSIPGLKPGLENQSSNITSRSIRSRVNNPDRATLTMWLEPVGIDVIDDLIKSGHLPDDSVKKAMPRHTLLPNRLLDPKAAQTNPVTIEWDFEKRADGFPENTALCFQTAPRAAIQQ